MRAHTRIAVAGATGRLGRHVVEVLSARGHDVVPMSRANGVDIVTGAGLAEALDGVQTIIDAASGPSPERQAATEFFLAAARNLQEQGERAGVRRIVVVSIIGCDEFTGGYGAAKVAHEQATLAGPVPARILRAAQFHEFVPVLIDWGRQGDVAYVNEMRTQLVAASSVAQAAADLAAAAEAPPITEVAGPREESLVAMARLLVARRGDGLRIESAGDAGDPDHEVYTSGALLPGPDAILAGPMFEEWLDLAAAA